jgi:hypothetical protein
MSDFKIFEQNASWYGQIVSDIYTLNLLQPLIQGYPFLPFTGSSFRPFCLAHILNDIIVNNRENIIEFGSGISTVLIGRLVKKNSLKTKILSVDHDESWLKVLSKLIENEKLEDIVSLLHAPLSENNLALENNKWYNLEVLTHSTKGFNYDMVIVDGPPAWEATKSKSRYPALPFMIDKLSGKYSIYLDDAHRVGERIILKKWEEDLGIKFEVTGGTLAYYYSGLGFYTEPFVYY